jgi:hypothetical protein
MAKTTNDYQQRAVQNAEIEKIIAFKNSGEEVEYSARESVRKLPSDFLVINDIVFDSVPATSIKINNVSDVFVAETLRTSSPVVEAKGQEVGFVNFTLAFKEGSEQTVVLRRLIAELIHHPFVFIENNKVRESLCPSSDANMIFVLYTGAMRVSADQPGTVYLDLQLASFNYAPFSKHFWYNAKLPVPVEEPTAGEEDVKDNDESTVKATGFNTYETQDYSASIFAKAASAAQLDSVINGINTPVVYPMYSQTWMYYADHLESLMPLCGEHNDDFLSFSWVRFKYINPTSPEAYAGAGSAKDFFRSDTSFKAIPPFFDARNKTSGSGQTPGAEAPTAAEKYASQDFSTTASAGGTLKQGRFTGGTHPSYWITDYDRFMMARLCAGETRSWTESKASRRTSEYAWMLWAMFQRFMCVGGSRFGRFLVAYSEPLNRTAWKKKDPSAWSDGDKNKKKTQESTWNDFPPSVRNVVNRFAAGLIPMPTAKVRLLNKTAKGYKGSEYTTSVIGYTDFAEPGLTLANKDIDKEYSKRVPPVIYYGNLYLSAHGAKTVLSPGVRILSSNDGAICDSDVTINAESVQPKPAPSRSEELADSAMTETADEQVDLQEETVDDFKAQQEIEKEEQRREKDTRSVEKRTEWITNQRAAGWELYTEDPSVRNVFWQVPDPLIVGGDTSHSMPNIALAAATITFGHRLAKMKLIGQDRCAWQFLGAGNRAGTLVFRAGGEEGRIAIRNLKRMVEETQAISRTFSNILGSGSIQVGWQNNEQPSSINNIFSLAKIKNIVISETSEQSTEGSVDLYDFVVEFVAQDIRKEQLDQRGAIDWKIKMAIGKRLLSLLKADENEAIRKYLDAHPIGSSGEQIFNVLTGDINLVRTADHYSTALSKASTLIGITASTATDWLNPAIADKATKEMQDKMLSMMFYSQLRTASDLHSIKLKDPKCPDWLSSIANDLAREVKEISKGFPLMNTPVKVKGEAATWEQKIAKELGQEAINLIGGTGVEIVGKGKVRGFEIYRNYDASSREASQRYRKLLTKLGQLADRAMAYAGRDSASFKSYFGEDVYKYLMSVVHGQMSECYMDLYLPDMPGLDVPLTPEFYVYDDSLEDATIAGYNDPKNLEANVKIHVMKQAASMEHYIQNALFGGTYASLNASQIRATKINMNEQFGAEYGFNSGLAGNYSSLDNLGASINLSVALGAQGVTNFAYDFTSAVANVFGKSLSFSPSSALKKYSTLSSKQGTEEERAFDGFLTNAISMSPYLTNYLDKGIRSQLSAQDKKQAIENIKASVYGTVSVAGTSIVPTKMMFGPDPNNIEVDNILSGNNNTKKPANDFSDLEGESRDTSWEEEVKQVEADEEHSGGVSEGHSSTDIVSVPATTISTNDLIAKAVAEMSVGSRKKDISMRRAYPTFRIYFIDEDSEQGTKNYRAFDDFYSYSSIQEIRVIRSRKVAADLAIIRMTNVAGILLRKRFGETEDQILANEKAVEDATGFFAETSRENPFANMILQDGVKVQIRLGYANDADVLETVFLGQIVEIEPNEDGKILEILCQGYGAELEASTVGAFEEDVTFYSSMQALSAAIIQPFIAHFGRFDLNAMYNPAEVRNNWSGGYGTDLLSLNPLDAWARASEDVMLKKYNFRNLPQDDNIFPPPYTVYADAGDRVWNNACAYRPLMITPWEVFKEHELRHPGYVSLAVPYGHSPRMTMFFGSKGQNYWCRPPAAQEAAMSVLWTDQVSSSGNDIRTIMKNPNLRSKMTELKKVNPDLYKAIMLSANAIDNRSLGFYLGRVFGRYRPFRNYFMATSEYHILKNEIRTSVQNTFNTVEVRYSNDEDVKDEASNEREAKEYTEMVEMGESGTYTMKLNDNIPDCMIRKYEAVYPSCITDMMAKRYAQGLLIEGLKDSYKGELILIGEETIKPYDVICLQDNVNDMYGPIEVEQVIHIFNQEEGFISIITPDMTVDSNDWSTRSAFDSTMHTMATLWVSSSVAAKQKSTQVTLFDKMKSTALYGTNATMNAMGQFAMMVGSFFMMHQSQTGNPVVMNPLYFGGKPFTSIASASKYSSSFANLQGQWIQYWEDFGDGYDRTDIAESLMGINWDIADGIAGWFNASTNPNVGGNL